MSEKMKSLEIEAYNTDKRDKLDLRSDTINHTITSLTTAHLCIQRSPLTMHARPLFFDLQLATIHSSIS